MSPQARKEFGRRLQKLLDQKDMNQSDLARLVWGTTKGGYAKNRDRISVYLRGLQWPNPRTMQKIATALSVQINDLAPEYGADAKDAEWSLVKTPGQDKVFLRIDKELPGRVAAKIIALLAERS